MLKTILTAIILYASTALDLLVILMLIFSKYPDRSARRDIYIGQYVGSLFLIAVSLFFAFVLHYVPQKWLLGFLGLIPIAFGIKYLISDEDEAAEVDEKLAQRQHKNLLATVALMTVASCGADNIGLFVPYFVSLTLLQLAVTLLVFIICIYLLVFCGEKFVHISFVKVFLARYGNWIMALIYIGLGGLIIWESGTLQHFIN
ncbi:CadD family cadmium resistance transporter [Loigolactobacillus binensis]|uniref:CadD family cadmium resistance transporter n=1 Tax=Loigolactobacillus binensis TaxID=2559922 RepID=A0ABW3EBM2_9LACO|nr:CadD family cadmium resistance transporter [Loigolactobacillus binensis]